MVSIVSSSVVAAVDRVWSLVDHRVLLLQSMACGRRGRSGANAARPAAMAPTTDIATALNRNMAAPHVQETTRTQKAASLANVQVTALTKHCQRSVVFQEDTLFYNFVIEVYNTFHAHTTPTAILEDSEF